MKAEDREFFREYGYWLVPDVVAAPLRKKIIEDVRPLFQPGVHEGKRCEIRVQDAWQESGAVRELAGNETVLAWLRFFYEREPMPFQTLHMNVGSQQRGHSDTIHFNSMPSGLMCGVWVALEDITPGSGPLFYFPRSHLLPEYDYFDFFTDVPRDLKRGGEIYARYEDRIAELMLEHGFEQKELIVPAGTALIWASNLVHGGSPITDPRLSRWNQVTHYFFEGCRPYTPMLSRRPEGVFKWREIRDARFAVSEMKHL